MVQTAPYGRWQGYQARHQQEERESDSTHAERFEYSWDQQSFISKRYECEHLEWSHHKVFSLGVAGVPWRVLNNGKGWRQSMLFFWQKINEIAIVIGIL